MGGKKTLEKEKQKYKIEQLQKKPGGQDTDRQAGLSVGRLVYLFIVGAIAISAMILPGISGSFVMLLFGVYFEILLAINNRDFTLLITFAIGCGLGLLAFTRLLNFLLERYHDLTVSFLIGLMIGSLYGLWPFREFEVVNSHRIDFAHVLPRINTNLAITFVAFLFGCVIILIFDQFEKLNQRA
jgi:putative membrane protein